MSYKTIQESFWTDPKVRQLSPTDKLLFLYLITNPHAHYSGLYYLPVSFMSEELGLSVRQINEGLANLERRLILRYDNDHSVVWVLKMCKHQITQGGNPKVLISGINKQLSNVHSISLVKEFIEYYQSLDLTLPERCANVDSTLCQGTVPVPVTDTVPVKEKRIVKEKNKTPLPDNFALSEKVKLWAAKKGYDHLDDHLEAFKRKASMNGYKYVDWDDAFMEAVREDWAKLRKDKYKPEGIKPVDAAGRELKIL